MKTWEEFILEANDNSDFYKKRIERNKKQKSRLRAAKASVAASKLLGGKKQKSSSGDSDSLKQQRFELEKAREARKKEYFDWQKTAEKRKKVDEPLEKARQAISNIKYQKTTPADKDPTAIKKGIETMGSIAGGLAGAVYHGARALMAKKKGSNQPERRERQPVGRPKKKEPDISATSPTQKMPQGNKSSFKKLPPARNPKGLLPPSKPLALPPSGETGKRPKAMTLGQRARQNPKIRAGLIAQRMNEEYSNWKEEFIFELRDRRSKKKEIVELMKGKNKIEINPEIREEKDYEGEMARNELDTMERAIKSLRKKIKSSKQQLPAWVQSKITKATDHIDTVADYMMGEHEKVDEEYLQEFLPLLAAAGELAAGAAGRAVAGRVAAGAASNTLRGAIAKKAGEVTSDVVKNKMKKRFLNQPDEKSTDSENPLQPLLNVTKFAEEKTPAWQRKEGKNPEGGLNKKGIASYRRENPGSKLSMAVTTEPSKLKKGSKSWKRRKSFCARMSGMRGPMKDEHGRPTRKALSLRKWNC